MKPSLSRTAGELARYAADRQARQLEDCAEWSRDILRGMAEASGAASDELIAGFDHSLAVGPEPLTLLEQRHVVQSLLWYVNALDRMDGDRRSQVMTVRSLLEGFYVDLRWDAFHTGVYPARDQAEGRLQSMTARRPIRFTRILLGGELDPGGVTFMPGLVDSPESVREIPEFQRLVQEYPGRKIWPAICTVYLGGGREMAAGTTDADELDMSVIREYEDRFLKQPGVRPVGACEIRVPVQEDRQRQGKTPRRKEAER